MKISMMERFYFISELVLDFFMLNLCWVLGTLIGGIIFGWAPSTIALLSVTRSRITDSSDEKAFTAFFKVYKKEFKQANKLGLIVTFFAYIIFVNQANFAAQEGNFFAVFHTLSQIAQWMLIGISLFVFPMYVHYETTLRNYFIKGFSFMFLRPIYTLVIGFWTWWMYSFIFMLPGIAFLFGISIFGYGLMAINYQLYRRNEDYLATAK